MPHGYEEVSGINQTAPQNLGLQAGEDVNTPPPSIDGMIKIVDHIMYEAKNGGKNLVKYAVFNDLQKW